MGQPLNAWTAIGKDLSFLKSPFRVQPNDNTTDLNTPIATSHPYTPFHSNAIKQALADVSTRTRNVESFHFTLTQERTCRL